MLRHAHGQGVRPHLAGPLPEPSAGVIAGALELVQTCGQMSAGIAAQQQRIAGGFAQGAVEPAHNLGAGARAVGEGPALGGGSSAHLETPAAKDVEGGEIMFEQAVAPAHGGTDALLNQGQHLGQ